MRPTDPTARVVTRVRFLAIVLACFVPIACDADPDEAAPPAADSVAWPVGEIQTHADGTLSIGGRKIFPVYMYDMTNYYFEGKGLVTPADPSKNGDFLLSLGGMPNPNTNTNYFANVIPKYEQAGVFYTLYGYGANLDTIPQERVASPRFFGFFQRDEPADTLLDSIATYYSRMKQKYPNTPVVLNHWKDMTKWAPYCDILTWDTYTIRASSYWPREDSIYAYEHYCQQAFFKGSDLNTLAKPVWAVIQANGARLDEGHPLGAIVVPTPQEARVNTYTALTMDVKGIGYWSYVGWGGSLESTPEFPYGTSGLYNSPQLHAYYRQLGRELHSLNDVLVLPTRDYSWRYRAGTLVSFSKVFTKTVLWSTRTNFNYLLKQSGGTSYLIVVNKDSRPIADVTVTVSGLTGGMTATTRGLETAGSSRAGRLLGVTNGTFTDSFDGYAVHVYEIR